MRHRKNKRPQISIRVLQSIIIILGLIILGRLFQLQILQHDTYGPLSRKNSLRQEVIQPARGLIYDRNQNLLVDNEPIYTITINPASYDSKNTPLLANLLGIPSKDVKKRVQKAKTYSWYRSSRLFTEINFSTFSIIQENIWRLPGIGHQVESKRHYPVDSLKASHLLGYLREVSKKEYSSKKNYHLGDKTGKSGLELAYQDQLRGTLGTKYIRINAMGQKVGPFRDGRIDEAPQKGADLITTIDTKLQLLAEDLLKDKRGAVVALNPDNGAVLSMASAPTYDIRKLSRRIDSTYWQTINADTTDPLFNRAVSSEQPPGSTFKPLMALMGLEMDIINPETEIESPGYYVRGRRYNDLADPGTYNVGKALQESSNTFFFWLMDQIATTKGLNRWHKLASSFGLGQRNNIDLPNEATGTLPDSSYFDKIIGKNKWGIGDQLNLGIGQGFMSASPLQMALVAAEIGNGGYWIQPHIVQQIQQSNGQVLRTNPKKEKISWVDKNELAVVKDGMRRVVTTGSGRYYADLDSITVAGKTGTAQNPHGKDHGWFISFAPVDDPKIAIAVLVENGGYGSQSAAPIASLMIEQYLNGEIDRSWVYNYVKTFNPINKDDQNSNEQDSVSINE
ncbi:peptidoglycan glycosyltransferase [Fodinibius salinus]|uniref:Peptidoglycan glycosyltransferase n=1 Tax=Fodinibius salinus TaxID=860790 RepID=A0A5D3YGC3_9BACT|nr:penicillin-binding protein 2 [Fodinibius salinus]TYP92602.1 peptidoglycan glycosyltransferase [Fodinibius salinus]